jgi:cohesin complex subunit SCC1
MFYSQVILAKKGPLAKVWLAAHWGDKKLARPQIFATDISQSCSDIMNPSVPLALRLSGHLLLGVVRIYSRKVKYVLNDCTEAMLKLQMAFSKAGGKSSAGGDRELLTDQDAPTNNLVTNFGEYDQVHVVEGFCLPLPEDNEWILAEDEDDVEGSQQSAGRQALLLAAHLPQASQQGRISGSPGFPTQQEETWAPFDPDNEDEDDDEDGVLGSGSRVSDIELVRAANDSMLSEDQVCAVQHCHD